MSTDSRDPQGSPGTGKKPGVGSLPAFARSDTLIVLAVQGTDGRIHRLHKERVVLGSVVSADVRLVADGISPIHAVIEVTRDPVTSARKATIYDLASDTGVFLNGSRVITQELRPGDELRLGQHARLVFSLEDVKKAVAKAPATEFAGQKLFMNPKEDLRPLLLEEQESVASIFDFRPSMMKQALEVVMSWHGSILDVEHFVTQKKVTIGGQKRADFAIPPILGSRAFPIVRREGETYVLKLDPQMRGIVQRQGQVQTLEQIRMHGTAAARTGEIALGKDDFAKVSVGEIDFYLSFTAAPPRLKSRRVFNKDPFFVKVMATSLILTALTIVAMLKIEVPRTIEAEKIPERLATILYQPEKYTSRVVRDHSPAVTEPKPAPTHTAHPHPKPTTKLDIHPNPKNEHKPIPKHINVAQKTEHARTTRHQGRGHQGEGARAKGKEGTRGSKQAARGHEHQTTASRPSPHGGHGRGGGRSQVADNGNVDLLKGASSRIQNLLGNASQKLGREGEKLKGFGGFTTLGTGGLALSGNGTGGGGTAETSLGGVGKRGRGGGRVGTGLGAAGSGGGIVGGETRVAIRTGGPEEAVVMGAIDAGAVEAALLAHRDEFRLCYEREINAEHPNLAGRVGTTFVIGSSGRVTQAGIESSTLKNANTERCILNVIRRIDFPIPRGAGVVQVSYPFKFSSVH